MSSDFDRRVDCVECLLCMAVPQMVLGAAVGSCSSRSSTPLTCTLMQFGFLPRIVPSHDEHIA